MPLKRYTIEGEAKASEDPEGDWCAADDVTGLERDLERFEQSSAETLTKLIAAEEAAGANAVARDLATRRNGELESAFRQLLVVLRDAVPDDASEKKRSLVTTLRALTAEVEAL